MSVNRLICAQLADLEATAQQQQAESTALREARRVS